MTELHLHLMIAHVPVLAVIFGAVVLAWGLIRRIRAVQEMGLVVLVVAGVAAGATYQTGEGAEEAVESSIQTDETLLEQHEAIALAGLGITGLAALVALVTLASGRKQPTMSPPLLTVALVISLVAVGTMAQVAYLGGQIGHPEIRSGAGAGTSQEAERSRASDERHQDERED